MSVNQFLRFMSKENKIQTKDHQKENIEYFMTPKYFTNLYRSYIAQP